MEAGFGFGKSEDGVDFSSPPVTKEGGIINVDLRTCFKSVSKLDSAEAEASVKLWVIMYWTDTRLIGWEGALPPRLWGPFVKVRNSLSGMERVRDDFRLTDNKTGRLKTVWMWQGPIEWHADIRRFPIDYDKITVILMSDSDFISFDESLQGGASQRTYKIREIHEAGEGTFKVMFGLLWDGTITEWLLHGTSHDLELCEADSAGNEKTLLDLHFHVTRKSMFYFWKGIMPLYILTLMGLASAMLEVDQYADRLAHSATMFLSAFAMLFVIGAGLPKTDFLTKIDIVVQMSILVLAVTTVLAMVVLVVEQNGNAELANKINVYTTWAMIGVYTLINGTVFIPAILARRKWASTLKSIGNFTPLEN